MKQRMLEIEVDANGKVTSKASGFKGGECDKIAKAIEEALGVVTDTKRTAEFYEKEVTQVQKIGG